MKVQCKIKTPQFRNNEIWYYKEQTGIFDDETLLFTADKVFMDFSRVGAHDVQFSSLKDFEKSKIRLWN